MGGGVHVMTPRRVVPLGNDMVKPRGEKREVSGSS